MILKPPVLITSRLLPGLHIGDGWVSIKFDHEKPGDESRLRYRWYIDIPAGDFEGNDLQSGNSRYGTDEEALQAGLESLLSFLGSAAESYRYKGMEGENADLFPEAVVEWAAQNSDEISMLGLELEEIKDLICEQDTYLR